MLYMVRTAGHTSDHSSHSSPHSNDHIHYIHHHNYKHVHRVSSVISAKLKLVLALVQGELGQEDFLACYAQLEGLCQAMMSELASDRRLHDSGILPQDVCLPQITAAQYCKVPT